MEANIRLPRPMGMTQALAQYHADLDPELLDKIQSFFIQQWLINNSFLCGRVLSIMELAQFLHCDQERIRLQMRDQLLSTKLWDRNKQDELIDSLIGQQITWALEDRMAIEGQVRLLQVSQGGKYTPFVTAEVNKALGMKLQTTNTLTSVLKSLQGGGSINIFNNQQNNDVNVGITMEQAVDIIAQENAKMITGSPELQYIESHYDVEQFPEVVATRQQGIDTSKEGIQLNSRELAMVTDNYKQLARGDDNDEDSHHNIRRERSYGIDEQGEDPELEIYQNE